jgi:hypothetical protein
VVPWIIVIALCLSQPGCKWLSKRSSGAPKSGGGGGADTATVPPADPAPAVIPTFDRNTPPSGANGFLAGQVIDSYNRHPGAATIQVVEATDGRAKAGAPIEVPVDGQGCFTIQGLQPGKRYEVTARAQDGSRVLTGTIVATPPDPRVVVRVQEDHAPPPAPPRSNNGDRLPKPAEQAADPLLGAPQNNTERTLPPAEPKRPAEAGASPERPAGTSSQTAPPADTRSEVRPESIAQDQPVARAERTEIPVLVPPWRAQPKRAAPNNNPGATAAEAAAVPSCVLTGDMLHNLALNDTNGEPWEFRKRTGRLVLLFFWDTDDSPSVQALVNLNVFQLKYAPHGLEIIGITYAKGGLSTRIEKANNLRRLRNIEYRLLLGADRNPCPVKTQFVVTQFPTLVLVDNSGKIVERVGLDRIDEMENIIRVRLAGK